MSNEACEQFVIYDHTRNLYWRAERCGYTAFMHDAGRYTKAECDDITSGWGGDREFTVYPAPHVLTDKEIIEIVSGAMRDAWNDICADSGARPCDLQRRGNKTFFEPSTWAELTGQMVATALVKAGFQKERGS